MLARIYTLFTFYAVFYFLNFIVTKMCHIIQRLAALFVAVKPIKSHLSTSSMLLSVVKHQADQSIS